MATQYDPIAKDESLNTTENPSRNIADVLAQGMAALINNMPATELNNLGDVSITSAQNGQTLKYNSTTQKWENANDAGGHTIIDSDDQSMTQRSGLAFPDAHTSDNSTDDQTEVEIMEATTEQAFDALNPSGNEADGMYLFKSGNAMPLTADMVGYGNGTVKGALDELADNFIADDLSNYTSFVTLLTTINKPMITGYLVISDFSDAPSGTANYYDFCAIKVDPDGRYMMFLTGINETKAFMGSYQTHNNSVRWFSL